MILSHKYKFLFIENPKTGSTSVVHFFRSNAEGILRIQKPSEKYPNCSRHCKLKSALLDFEEAFDYFKFCFVRNPWDMVVSWFFFHKKKGKIDDDLIFEDYIRNDKKFPSKYFNAFRYDKHFNFIGKFENLDRDFNFICEKIGVKYKKLGCVNTTNHKHYTEYYNDTTRKIIAEKTAEYIEYFGYEFGE